LNSLCSRAAVWSSVDTGWLAGRPLVERHAAAQTVAL
jgi:hypothetical protein